MESDDDPTSSTVSPIHHSPFQHIRHLLHSTSSQPDSISYSHHLLTQRLLSLFHLQRTQLSWSAGYDSLVDAYAIQSTYVEHHLAQNDLQAKGINTRSPSIPQSGSRAFSANLPDLTPKIKLAEAEFVDKYESLVQGGEVRWKSAQSVFERNELVLGEAEIDPRWIWPGTETRSGQQSMGKDEIFDVVAHVVQMLVSDPYALGAGIVTLEGEALNSLLPSSASNPCDQYTSLQVLIQVVYAARGSGSVFQLALGAFEMGIKELIGRAQGNSRTPSGTSGLGFTFDRTEDEQEEDVFTDQGFGSRERETELSGFLVGFLELLQSFHFVVGEGSCSEIGSGPLNLSRPIEDDLLKLLHDTRELNSTTPKSPRIPRPAPQQRTERFGSWSSTFASTLSKFDPLAQGLYSVANGAAGLVFSPSFGSSFVSGPSKSESERRRSSATTSPSTSIESSLPTNESASPSAAPSLPRESCDPPTSPAVAILLQGAISLLKHFTPDTSSISTTPLVEQIIRHLLSISFPPSSAIAPAGDDAAHAHAKVLELAIVRWWSFRWLGTKLGRASYGGLTSGLFSSLSNEGVLLRPEAGVLGVHSSSSTSEEDLFSVKAKGVLLNGITILSTETVEVLLGAQRWIYRAIVEACTGDLEGLGPDRSDEAKEDLRAAASDFLKGWSTGTPDRQTSGRSGTTAISITGREWGLITNTFGGLIISGFVASVSRQSSSTERQQSAKQVSHASTESPRTSAFSTPTIHRILSSATSQKNRDQSTPPESPRMHKTFERPSTPLIPSISQSRVESGFGCKVAFVLERLEQKPTTEEEDSCDDLAILFVVPLKGEAVKVFGDVMKAFRLGRGQEETKNVNSNDKSIQSASSAEIGVLKRALFSLARSDGSQTNTTPDRDLKKYLVDTFVRARKESTTRRDFVSAVSYDHAAKLLQSWQHASISIESILTDIARPWQQLHDQQQREEKSVAQAMLSLATAHSAVVTEARQARVELDSMRLRSWSASTRASSVGLQLRTRLRELDPEVIVKRTDDERVDASETVSSWREEMGLVSFIGLGCIAFPPGEQSGKSGDDSGSPLPFEEGLVLLETAVAISLDPSNFYGAAHWAPERAVVVQRLEHQHTIDDEPMLKAGAKAKAFASSLLASGTSILSMPLSLAGLRTHSRSQSQNFPTEIDSLLLLPSGATLKALNSSQYHANRVFTAQVEDHLAHAQLALVAYTYSELCASGLFPVRDGEGKRHGSDAWFEELTGPLSPLTSTETGERGPGSGIPAACLSNDSVPGLKSIEHFVGVLLERFIHHPAITEKLDALLEVETIVASVLSAPASALTTQLRGGNLQRANHARGASHVAKIAELIPAPRSGPRRSLSPTAMIRRLGLHEHDLETSLKDSSDSIKEEDERTVHLSTAPSSPRHTTRPLSLMTMSDASSIQGLASPMARSFNLHELPAVKETPRSEQAIRPFSMISPSGPVSTDDILVALESLLLRHRPQGLFQCLELIATLSPARARDASASGKAFWDLVGASLGLKREIVDGPSGVVERAQFVGAKGGSEDQELRKRLIQIGEYA